MTTTIKTKAVSQRGNALFLILIAVALFAALSYAVTQSGRGGGGIDREQSLINASQLTQYPAALRTTVTRMVITGTAVSALNFRTDTSTSPTSADVFGTSGGAAVSQAPPAASGATVWRYITAPSSTSGWYVDGVGSTATEVVAFVSGINLATCTAINRGLGFTTTAPQTATTSVGFPATNEGLPTQTGGAATGTAANTFGLATGLSGQPFACYNNGTSGAPVYVYYHALVEQ